MAGNYLDSRIGCPFYRSTDGWRVIRCEGIVDDSCVSLSFGKKRDYKIQINGFCGGSWHRCEIYRMLLAKYEEDNGC